MNYDKNIRRGKKQIVSVIIDVTTLRNFLTVVVVLIASRPTLIGLAEKKTVGVWQVFYELQVKWNINLLQLPGLCELYPVLFLTAQHLSPLLVLAFTTDRYVSVCHPFEQERFCSRRRPLATICVLTAIALAINAVQAYFWTYNYENGDCGLRPEVRTDQSSHRGGSGG